MQTAFCFQAASSLELKCKTLQTHNYTNRLCNPLTARRQPIQRFLITVTGTGRTPVMPTPGKGKADTPGCDRGCFGPCGPPSASFATFSLRRTGHFHIAFLLQKVQRDANNTRPHTAPSWLPASTQTSPGSRTQRRPAARSAPGRVCHSHALPLGPRVCGKDQRRCSPAGSVLKHGSSHKT